jgi:predicted AlkP superfamily pyrophosphatase or phosphodiesterase
MLARLGAALAVLPVLAVASPATAGPVVLISIDGLRPGDVIEAEKRGLKIPNLRAFLRDGAHATAVVGVLPTVTYPSHATLLTGVSPAKHGIVGNTTFDPTSINQGGWYWYAEDIKVPTLWDAAQAKGLTVGNVHWPVSVGAKSITWNLPQLWRTGHADDEKLNRALATPGLLAPMEARLGVAYARGIDEEIAADENRGRFAIELIASKKPDFTTVYLTAYDHYQHRYGPGAAEAHAIIERIDAIVGRLVSAARAARPDVTIAVVSDHGFETTTTEASLYRPFIDAGLITLDKDGKIARWDAVPWNSGGSIAIVLARPDDAVLASKVRGVLDRLARDPAGFIGRIAESAGIAAMGGNPQATFYVSLKPGFLSGGFEGAQTVLTRPAKYKGMHGYFPDARVMRSTFLIMGPAVARGRSLGEIDMRKIAPTLAAILGVDLSTAEMGGIALR